MKRLVFCFLTLLLCGVAHSSELPPDAMAAQALLETIAKGDMAKAGAQLSMPDVDPAKIKTGLDQIKSTFFNVAASRQYFSENRKIFLGTKGKFYSAELRVEEGPEQSYLLRYSCKDLDGKYAFDTFRLIRVSEEDRALAEFSIMGHSIGQYAFALLGVFIAIFSLYSAVVAWKSGFRRRVFWSLGCLLSFVRFDITWTPYSEFLSIPIPAVKFSQMLFLGASLLRKGSFQPFVMSIAIPIGAICFWYVKRKADDRLASGSQK